MNSALTSSSFWRLYFFGEAEDISARDIELQLHELAQDFVVRTDTITYQHQGQTHSAQIRFVEFRFPCGNGVDLLVEYELNPQHGLDPQGSAITLYLHDAASNDKQRMGWWDSVRWHPYCLHPEELDTLLRYWAHSGSQWPDERIALLLLAPFVGLSDEPMLQSLSARVDAAYRALCPQAIDDPPLPIQIPEPDYRWDHDDLLGLVFTGAYPCYSIRNKSHLEPDKGPFPFSQFGEVIRRVRLSSDPPNSPTADDRPER